VFDESVSFRHEFAHIVATLTRILGPRHLSLAEEVAQDALIKAMQTWPHDGAPSNPSAWLIQVAKNRAIDAIRRETKHQTQNTSLPSPDSGASALHVSLRGEPAVPDDDELLMMFLVCHPVLPREGRIALTLKTVCGFGVGEIARALLSREDAVAQRLVRAKRQLRDADVRFTMEPAEYPERLESVLDAIYLLFNEGYAAHGGEDLVREELCGEAIRLVTLVADSSLAAPAVHALLALMCLQAARLPARVGAANELLRLSDQDRSRWDGPLLAAGFRALDRASAGDAMTIYHLEAGIAACHAAAPSFDQTDWRRIVELYDLLVGLKPTPIVALNRAIAVAKLEGPRAGLAALQPIADDPVLARYYLLHAAMGELTWQAGDPSRASDDFRKALACECSEPERRFLERRLGTLQAEIADQPE
jgi:RNA polymerase sigma-70 factor, ECF subfamily